MPNDQVKEYFDALALEWDEKCIHIPERLFAIAELFSVEKGARIADIACGTGVMLPALLKKDPKEILALDLSENMIAAAKKKIPDARIRFAALDLLELCETGFDGAMVYCAYPHFLEKEKFYEKIHEILNPGGRLMIAHSPGREAINVRHGPRAVSNISVPLEAAEKEALRMGRYFSVDLVCDTKDFYILSGIK